MRIILVLAVISVSLGFSQITFAVCGETAPNTFTCNTNPPNPDPNGIQQNGNHQDLTINVLPGAAIDTGLQPELDDDGIFIGNGNNVVSVEDGSVTGQDTGINIGRGNNQISIINSEVFGVTDDAIGTSRGNYIINIIDSTIKSLESDNAISGGRGNHIINVSGSHMSSPSNDVIDTSEGQDNVNVSNSEILVNIADGFDRAITLSGGNDILFVETSVIQGGRSSGIPIAISLGTGDDVLTIGNDVEVLGVVPGDEITSGIIFCSEGFDTIIFAMDVPPDLLNGLSSELFFADPLGDTIVINGLTYMWQDCELLVNELTPGERMTRPIPTLSEWGLIAMAGVLGLVGLLTVRRRARTY